MIDPASLDALARTVAGLVQRVDSLERWRDGDKPAPPPGGAEP